MNAGGIWWRLQIWPLIAALILAAGGYWPTYRLAGPTGSFAMLTAIVLTVAVVYLTLWLTMRPMALAAPAKRLGLALKAGVVRFLVTLPAAVVIARKGGVEPRSFLIWVAIAYIVMIKVETFVLIRWVAAIEKQE